jgi:hypothetical protein
VSRAVAGADQALNVFINCPFDDGYRDIFDALIFAVIGCGYIARCALENENASEVRIEKIVRIIGECPWGIHDLSRTTLDPINRLPRFNMPLELGIFLGAKAFGKGAQARKSALIVDTEPYRYQKFISDISGQDIKAHNGEIEQAMRCVRNWLPSIEKGARQPGARALLGEYEAWLRKRPEICEVQRLAVNELTFDDKTNLIFLYLQEARRLSSG